MRGSAACLMQRAGRVSKPRRRCRRITAGTRRRFADYRCRLGKHPAVPMSKFNEEWKVEPYGPLEQLDDGLLTVAGDIRMPLGNFPRRMTVVGLSDHRAAIWSAMPLREPDMRKIEAVGDPAFLIVPGIAHRLDIKPWKQRYPE